VNSKAGSVLEDHPRPLGAHAHSPSCQDASARALELVRLKAHLGPRKSPVRDRLDCSVATVAFCRAGKVTRLDDHDVRGEILDPAILMAVVIGVEEAAHDIHVSATHILSMAASIGRTDPGS